MHGLDDLPGGLGVVPSFGVMPRHFRVPELEVGHVDVDEPIHQFNGMERIVRTGVVDQGQAQTTLNGQRQGLENLGHYVLGGDEVDIMAALFLEPQHHGGQVFGTRALAAALPTDVVVLAENAAQVTPGKENRARTVPAAQAVLLAEVRKWLPTTA